MMGSELLSPFQSTSAAGPMRARQSFDPVVLIGLMLAGLGTSNTYGTSTELEPRVPLCLEQTTTGAALKTAARSGSAITELRRLSGLTWDQLARLFGVNRRSLHFWASGKDMSASHEEHLHRLLAVVRRVDRGSASANRSALLAVHEGHLPFDLLVARKYDQVFVLLGAGSARRAAAPRLSPQAMRARAPRPPEELVDARQERAHEEDGPPPGMKAVRIPRGK
ncbi:MAG: XRE family transcriptional regulator [Myxococcaceae bacterium]|nr:MAG: XRE family transcriptional regulator [Myxococcaceae bacterium]